MTVDGSGPWVLFLSALLSSTLLPGGSEMALVMLATYNEHDSWVPWVVASAGNTLGGMSTWGVGRFVDWWSGLTFHLPPVSTSRSVVAALGKPCLVVVLGARRGRSAVCGRRVVARLLGLGPLLDRTWESEPLCRDPVCGRVSDSVYARAEVTCRDESCRRERQIGGTERLDNIVRAFHGSRGTPDPAMEFLLVSTA